MAFTERLMAGVNISILGMGLVFLLLALLWGLLTVLLRLDREPPSGDITESGRIDRPAAVTPRGWHRNCSPRSASRCSPINRS